MRPSRSVGAALMAAAVVLTLAAPAWAHEEINPKTVSTGSPVFLTLTAANEAKSDLTKVVLTAPKGIAFGEATRAPSGWAADRTDTTITWSGGKVAPDNFENFGFELDNVAQPGTMSFGVALTAGKTEQVTVNITAAPASATTTTAASGSTTVVTAPVPTATVPASVNKSVDSAKSRANTAAILAAIGIGIGVIAVVLALAARGRRPANAPPQDF